MPSHRSLLTRHPLRFSSQRCFLPGGTLALPGMSAAAAGDLVAKVRALARSGGYGAVAWTQDWHPRGHVSFARTHGKRAFADAVDLRYAAGGRVCGLGSLFPNSTATCAAAAAAAGGTGGNGGSSSSSSGSSGSGSGGAKAGSGAQSGAGQAPAPVVASVHQALWPEHCVAGTADAALAPGLAPRPGDIVVRKGSRPSLDAYSAFFDNAHLWASGLAAALRRRGVGSVTIAGVALDYCVRATALDAVGEGFATRVVLDATAPVSAAAAPAVERELRARGVEIVTAAQEAAEAAALAAAAGKTKAAAAATPAAAG